ncbi:MAG: MFS transporter [Candidatus Hodarchaeales archaeon]|jgi:MFS family permease
MVLKMLKTDTNSYSDLDPTKRVIFLGILTLFTITATALLHTNQTEFILDRFPNITELELSYFDTTLYISYFLMGICIGIISDQLGKRRLFVIIGSLGSAVFYFLMTLTTNYPVLLVFRFFQGCFTVITWQILMTLLLDVSTSKNRGKNMGIYGIFLALAMGLGPMLGGFIASIDVFIPYYTSVILSTCVFILSALLVQDPDNLKKNPSLKQNLSIVKNNPKIVIPSLFNFIDRMHMGFLLYIIPLYISIILDLEPELRGMALGIYALPFILLQYPAGRLSDKYGRFPPIIIGSIGYGIILSVLGYFGSFGFIYFVFFLFILGIFSGITFPPVMALVSDSVKKEDNAMGMGFYSFFGNLGITIGPLLGGILINFGSYTLAFFVAGLLEVIVLLVSLVIIVQIFHEPILPVRSIDLIEN